MFLKNLSFPQGESIDRMNTEKNWTIIFQVDSLATALLASSLTRNSHLCVFQGTPIWKGQGYVHFLIGLQMKEFGLT